MKKGLFILVAALAVGMMAFYVTRTQQTTERKEVLLDAMPELAWLHRELELTDEQFTKLSKLHADYRPQCAEMCRRLAETHAKLESLARRGRGMTPELEQAIRTHASVHAECQERMLEHLYQTAALMDDHQAARYLETVLPRALESTTSSGVDGSRH